MSVSEAIADGLIGGRLWFYTNYHCNLRCAYCLTESAPGVRRRELGHAEVVECAREARGLGFRSLGVTGGEPFVLDYMPELLAALGAELPTIVLSNATVFNARRLRRLEPLADLPVQVQVSLDHADPEANDELRGPGSFQKVVAAVPRLIERGIGVRISTTLADPEAADPEEMERLCELHRALGISDDDHVVRPIAGRGRAETNATGVAAGLEQLDPELTLTADGAFYSPVGPTVRGGALDTDLLVSRTTRPVSKPAETLVRIASERPSGDDASTGIR